MKFTIVATILLGLVLTPAFGLLVGVKGGQEVFPGQDDTQIQYPDVNKKTTIVVGSQVLTLNWQWRVATIQKTTPQLSFKSIWNYNTGVIATKLVSERVCYISMMDRNVMPTFDALPTLTGPNSFPQDLARPTKEIVYVIKRPVHNLQSYGQDVFNMCRGLTTYETYEVHGPQYTVNQGACTRLDFLHILDLVYCRPNIKA